MKQKEAIFNYILGKKCMQTLSFGESKRFHQSPPDILHFN